MSVDNSLEGATMDALVLVHTEEHVTYLTLNRPLVMNALDEPLADALGTALEEATVNPDLRVIVLRGAGRSFCTGGDLSMLSTFTTLEEDDAAERMYHFYQKYLKLRESPVPVIAAVQGSAIGAGACLALACDLRIARSDARFSFNFVRLGLHPGLGATEFLPTLVGAAQASEMLLTGGQWNAEDALRLGLVHRMAPEGLFNQAVEGFARELVHCGPMASRLLVKQLRSRVDPVQLERALRFEARAQARCYRTEDFREGIAAAREKRQPIFRGH